MYQNTSLASYRQISLETAPPGDLVLMLYDGLVKFLSQARSGFELEDPLERNQTIHNNTLKALDILNELTVTLDMEQGGQLAETLRDLYLYMRDRLQQSNVKKESAGIDEVIERITVVRDAWAQMLQEQQVSGHEPEGQLAEAMA